MDRDTVAAITDRMFNRLLEVRRALQGGRDDIVSRLLPRLAALGRKLEPMIAREELERATEQIAGARLDVPRIEVSSRDGFARWAASYDDEANPLIAMEEPATLEVLGDVAGKDLLDAACGTGRYALRLAQAGARVCGVDVSEEMLAVARRKRDQAAVDIDLRVGDLTALPYPDASFDVAVCALTFCHLPNLHPATAELARVLRPGGRLVVSDFHPFCLLIGWRTALRRPEATYFIENHLHLAEDYLGAMRSNRFIVADLREAVVDDRLVPILSQEEVDRFRGWPGALIIAARREGESGGR